MNTFNTFKSLTVISSSFFSSFLLVFGVENIVGTEKFNWTFTEPESSIGNDIRADSRTDTDGTLKPFSIDDHSGSSFSLHHSSFIVQESSQKDILVASDTAKGNYFGNACAISGDIAIIGASSNDSAGFNSGSAYIFYRHQLGTDKWGEVKRLTATVAAEAQFYGLSVAIDGDTAIVGIPSSVDPLNPGPNTRSGIACIYERSQGGANNWGEVKKIMGSDVAPGNQFGHSVAISGDFAIVGSLYNGDKDSFIGIAYIYYRHQGGTNNWGEVKRLVPSDSDVADYFGMSVTIIGDYALVGASGNDSNVNDSGSAYIFYRHKGGTNNWGEMKKITASDAKSDNYFGSRVALSGDFAVVSAPYSDDSATNSGSVYIYYRNEGGINGWGEVKKLTAYDAATNDLFGYSLALSGDYIMVGAPWDDDAGS